MIQLACDIKPIEIVACSGGPDSIAALTFLQKNSVKAAYFNHGTHHGEIAEEFVKKFCTERGIDLIIGDIASTKPDGASAEAYWRDERYKFLNSLGKVYTTAHNLNDLAETFIMGCIHGNTSRNMYVSKGNMRRAFLYTEKSELLDWCHRKNFKYVVDPSNTDQKYDRSIVRINIMPHILSINPGFLKVVRNKFNGVVNEQ